MDDKDLQYLKAPVTLTDKATGDVVKTFDTSAEAYNAGYLSGLSPNSQKVTVPQYYKVNGEYTTERPSSRLELDKKTGKITLVNNSDSLTGERLDQVVQNMNLEALSKSYKTNPKAALPVTDGSGETRTVEQIIEDFNTPNLKSGLNTIDTYAAYYQTVDNIKMNFQDTHKAITENGEIVEIDFTDDQILRYQNNLDALKTIQSTAAESLTDDTRIAIDRQFAQEFGLDKLNSWDEATETIGAKNFMQDYYSRKRTDWESKIEVDPTTGSRDLGLFIRLQNYISGQSSNVVEGPNGELITQYTHRDDQTASLASAISVYTLLKEVDPVCTFWQNAGDIAESVLNGVETAAEKIGEAGAIGISLMADGIATKWQFLHDKSRGEKFTLDRGMLPSRMFAKWMGYGDGRSFYDISDTVRTQGIEKIQAEISKYNSTAQGVYVATEFLTEMAIMIAAGNALANGAKTILAEAAASTTRGAALLANSASMANGLSTTWQLSGNVAKAASVTLNTLAKAMNSKLVTASVGVLAESVGEALIQNPGLTGKILAGEELTPEAKELVWSTLIPNTAAVVGTAGASKFFSKIGDTPIGMAVSRDWKRLIWAVGNWVGDTSDAVRVFFSNEDNILDIINKGNPLKRDVRLQKRIARAAKEVVLENTDTIKLLGMSSDDLMEAVAKYDDELARYMNVENALDFMATRGTYTATAMLADPNTDLHGAWQNYSRLQNELVEEATAAGLKSTVKEGFSILNDKVKDYVTIKQHVDILNAYKTAIQKSIDVGVTLKEIDKELAHFVPILEGLQEELSAQVIAKSDEFIDANRKLWRAWTDYRVDNGLLDTDEIKALRAGEKWGNDAELYVGQLRKVESPKYQIRRTDGLQDVRITEEIGRYKFGSTQGFVDPTMAFQNSLLSTAQKYDRQLVLQQFRGTSMVSTVYDADKVALVANVNRGKTSLNKGIREAIHSSMDNVKTSGLVDAVGELKVKGKNIEYVSKELAEGTVISAVDDLVEGIYKSVSEGDDRIRLMLKSLVDEYAPENADAARKYLVYDSMQRNMGTFRKELKNTVFDELQDVKIDGKTLNVNEAKRVANDITKRIEEDIKTRLDFNRVELSRAGEKAKTLIDYKAWNQEISDLATEMGDLQAKNPNVVTVQDGRGRLEMIEVDPLLASFLTTSSPTAGFSDSALARLNYAWMKLFRFGTTGPNPITWVNQFFRDFGNAWLVGGATKTIAEATDIIADAFGSNTEYYFSQFSAEALETASQKALANGTTQAYELAKSEVTYGKKIVTESTESKSLNAYRKMRNLKYTDGALSTSKMSEFFEKTDEVMDSLNYINDAREHWLRGRVYANNYAKAVQQGKTISQARTWGQFYSSNATTNFSRATSFLAGIQNTIPYLRSAINGTKSFWRVWSVDPVGVTGRIVGGLVIPMIGLTVISLNSEDNRKVYKNIKEYQKENSLAFVVEGKAFFIPIPQEIATVIAPVRQVVESIYDVDTNTFSELAFSDILGLSPLDLAGFADLDSYKIYDEGFWERMQKGVTKLAAQIMPKYLNTAVAVATGRDLYTGNKIDTSYITIDPDTGEARVMDYNSGQFAKALNSAFPNISAAMAENILRNTIGAVGVGIFNWGTDMLMSATGQQSWADTGTNIVEGLAGAVTSPFTAYVPQDEAETAFKKAVQGLYAEKEALMQGQEYQAYLKLASSASSEEQINAASVARTNIVEAYFEKVKTMVEGYTQNYGRGLTQAQLASTISLMVFNQSNGGTTAIARQADDEAYAAARAQALTTMQKFGFPDSGSQDAIFGRIRTNSAGDVYVEYNNPIAVLDYKQTNKIAGQYYAAEIQELLTNAGLTNMNQVWSDIRAAKTTAEKDKIKQAWDLKVAQALKPYIDQYGAKNVANNTAVVDYLDSILLVPNFYTKRGKKSTYHENLDQQRGFAKDFIEDVFMEISQ